jgi:glucosamine-6-phosphate deaminase
MVQEFSIDQLRVCVYKNKYQLGKAAADLAEKYISEAIYERREAVIILATGSSQFEFLESLVEKNLDWQKVIAFHLDEYVGITENHAASFRKYLHERFIDKISMGHFHFIEGDRDDIDTELRRLDGIFREYKVDVAFTGIGENGHLAFNEPPAYFQEESKFKIIKLDETSRQQQVGEGWFKSIEEVPKRAITMTIPAIMESKAIICNVPDARKAIAVKKTLTNNVSPDCPASILRAHPAATLFLDRKSASMLSEFIIDSVN